MTVCFEDLHDHDSVEHYLVPNESTLNWRELLKGIPIFRAGAICSSGEVGFLGLLPLVRRELVLVDHSYRSLNVAISKYLLLQEKGPKETYRLLCKSSAEEIQAAIDEVQAKLPPKVREVFHGYYKQVDSYNRVYLRKEWEEIPPKLVYKACRKLNRVKFIHGDLTDLAAQGPFNLLYLSNALQHNDRTNRAPRVDEVLEALKPGGYVVLATMYYSAYNNDSGPEPPLSKRNWTLVNRTGGVGSLWWDQQLWQVH